MYVQLVTVPGIKHLQVFTDEPQINQTFLKLMLMMQWVVGSIPHGGSTKLFLVLDMLHN